MKQLYDLFDQLDGARVFLESIYSQTIIQKTTFMTHLDYSEFLIMSFIVTMPCSLMDLMYLGPR